MQKNAKKYANISLLIMAIGFACLIPFQEEWWQKLLLGGFEAGVVGALADWFAVTALFRHPLGIPIPHTALLPKNRDKMTKTLVNTLENDWLNKDSITEKVNQFQLSDKIMELTTRELHKKENQEKILHLIQKSVGYIQFEKLSPILEKNIRSFMMEMKTDSFVTKFADGIVQHRYDEKILDLALSKVITEASKGKIGETMARTILEEIEKRKSNSIFNIALKTFKNVANEEKLSEVITNVLIQKAADLKKSDDRHRLLILTYIQNELQKAKQNEQILDEVQKWKNNVVENLNLDNMIQQGIQSLQTQIHDFVHHEQFMEKHLLPMIEKTVHAIENNPDKVKKAEAWVKEKLIDVIEQNHSKIGQLVQNNLDKLNNEELIYMIEEKLAKDLSWIRVNGAICGFLIGLILSAIKIFM